MAPLRFVHKSLRVVQPNGSATVCTQVSPYSANKWFSYGLYTSHSL